MCDKSYNIIDDEDIELERKIIQRGVSAPRVTLEDLPKEVKSIEIVKHVIREGRVLRWAILELENGYVVTSNQPSISVSAENDNEETGVEIAISNAKPGLYAILGYKLKERLYQESLREDRQ